MTNHKPCFIAGLRKCLKLLCCNIETYLASFKVLKALKLTLRVIGGIVLVFHSYSLAFAGFERNIHPASVVGRALAGTAISASSSIQLNPSAIASLKEMSAEIFYSPSPFGLPELTNGGALTANTFSFGSIGIGLEAVGFSLYRETTARLTYATVMGNHSRWGASLSVYHLSIEQYGEGYAFGIDVGGMVDIADTYTLGASLTNINRPSFGDDDISVPQEIRFGISSTTIDDTIIDCDVVKELRFPASVRLGIEFSPLEIVQLRCGYMTEPERLSFGLGVNVSSFCFDYGAITHADLGLTHSVGITFIH